jgi:hypothetical protein
MVLVMRRVWDWRLIEAVWGTLDYGFNHMCLPLGIPIFVFDLGNLILEALNNGAFGGNEEIKTLEISLLCFYTGFHHPHHLLKSNSGHPVHIAGMQTPLLTSPEIPCTSAKSNKTFSTSHVSSTMMALRLSAGMFWEDGRGLKKL